MISLFVALSLLTPHVECQSIGAELVAPGRLEPGQWLQSTNNEYRLVMQQDGNLVLRDQPNGNGGVLWAAFLPPQGPPGNVGAWFQVQDDGNLVIYRPGPVVVWNGERSSTGAQPFKLVMQNDRNCVFYTASNTPIWTSGTGIAVPPYTVRFPFVVPSLFDCSEKMVVVYDATGLPFLSDADNYEGSLALASLAGIVNRNAPMLYVRMFPYDQLWLNALKADWLSTRTAFTERGGSLAALIDSMSVRRAVLYSTSSAAAASAMVAATAAGVLDAIPIAKRDEAGSLYRELVLSNKLSVALDLTTTSCQTKSSCYRYAIDQFSSQTSSNIAAYFLDYRWVALAPAGSDLNSRQTHTAMNADYFVAKKAFFFDLSPWDDESPSDALSQNPADDVAYLKEILSKMIDRQSTKTAIHVGGFVPWAFKYTDHGGRGKHAPVPSEWRYAYILSQYNAFMDADACCLGSMANGAFFALVPPKQLVQKHRRAALYDVYAPGDIVSPKRYYAFYVGDYDAASWLNNELQTRWSDPKRGSLPLSWGINPLLTRRAPLAFRKYFEEASANDVFTAGEGPGYLNPQGLIQRPISGLPNGAAVYNEFATASLSQFDMSAVGYVINGDFGADLSVEALDAHHSWAGDGIAVNGQTRATFLHKNMPVIQGTSLPESMTDAVQHLRNLFGGIGAAPAQPQFVVARTVLKSPTYHSDFFTAMITADPHSVLVDFYSLAYLARRHLGGNNDNRVAYIGDNLEGGPLVLAPGPFVFQFKIRNDATNQYISQPTHELLVLIQTPANQIVYQQVVKLSDAVPPRGGISSMSGTLIIPNVGQQRLNLIYELIERTGERRPLSKISSSPFRAYSIMFGTDAIPTCPPATIASPTPATTAAPTTTTATVTTAATGGPITTAATGGPITTAATGGPTGATSSGDTSSTDGSQFTLPSTDAASTSTTTSSKGATTRASSRASGTVTVAMAPLMMVDVVTVLFGVVVALL